LVVLARNLGTQTSSSIFLDPVHANLVLIHRRGVLIGQERPADVGQGPTGQRVPFLVFQPAVGQSPPSTLRRTQIGIASYCFSWQ
jgi:hypothetical protein